MGSAIPLTIDSFVEIAPGLVKKLKRVYPINHGNIRFERVNGCPMGPVIVATSYDNQYCTYRALIGGIPIGTLTYEYEPLDADIISLEFNSKRVNYKRTNFPVFLSSHCN